MYSMQGGVGLLATVRGISYYCTDCFTGFMTCTFFERSARLARAVFV